MPRIASDVRKFIGGEGTRHSLTDKFSGLTTRWRTQKAGIRASRFLIMEVALRCELLGRHKISVTRRMYAKVPTRRSDLSYE